MGFNSEFKGLSSKVIFFWRMYFLRTTFAQSQKKQWEAYKSSMRK